MLMENIYANLNKKKLFAIASRQCSVGICCALFISIHLQSLVKRVLFMVSELRLPPVQR